jgi:Bacterial protein of unknown function (DUF916)
MQRVHLDRLGRPTSTSVVRALLGLALAGLLIGGAAPASADPSAPASPPVTPKNATFGIQPSGPKGPDGRGYFGMSATPGARATDYVAIRNYRHRPLTLTLGVSDGVNTESGDFALTPADQAPKDMGTWLHIPPSRRTVRVPPRGTVVVPFRIVIPRNATPGDHAGGLTATLESSAVSGTGQRYRLLQTVGARVFVRVSGPLHPDLVLENIRSHFDGSLRPGRGAAIVTYTIRNVGNVALGGHQELRISGLLGLSATAQGPDLGVLLPGSSVTRSVEVDGVIPQVWMNASVSVSPLILPGTVQQLPDAYTGSVQFWAIPWWVLFIVIPFLLLAWWRRRRRRRGPGAPGRGKEEDASPDEEETGMPASAHDEPALADEPVPALARDGDAMPIEEVDR